MKEVREILDHFYVLEEEGVRMFLITCEDEALLADALANEAHPTLPCRIYHGRATDFFYEPVNR